MARRKIGIWIFGAKGGVASTVTVGLIALKKGLAPNHGLVSQLPLFARLDLAGFGDFTIGGHEVRDVSLYDEAMQLVRVSKAIDGDLVARSTDDGRGSKYSVGERVFHLKFGYGRIESIEGNKLSIDFEKAGKKKVLDSFVSKG